MQYLFCIFDRVSGLYGAPLVAVSQPVIIRQFDYLVSTRPVDGGDLELYSIGTFDPETGVVEAFPKPVFVKKAEVQNNG